MLLALPAVAYPQLDTSNPTGFFTNFAMAMFHEMDLHDFNGNLVTITNIPIYEDPARFGGTNINYYTPAVHRILQLAANIFDATTNRFVDGGPTNYPTVFRPIFSSQNGTATIIGYQEVTSPNEAFLPMLNASDFVRAPQPVNSSINMYGVPWVIGAKKGFPNFNQFSMENSLTVSRKLQFTNTFAGPPWFTNQVYRLNITNTFGVDAWNSYTNGYGRPLRLVVSNAMSIIITNQFGPTLLEVTNLAFGTDTYFTNWPGWSEQISDNSFQIPLYASQVYTNGIYDRTAVIPLAPPMWDAAFLPRLWMELQFRLRFVLIDTAANRVVDFVNLVSAEPVVDITGVLASGSTENPSLNLNPYEQWATNSAAGGALMGILNQIFASGGEGGVISDWRDTAPNIAAAQSRFRNLVNNGGTNNFQAPYTPARTIYQLISLQANDPLVHYTIPDLTSTNGIMAPLNRVTLLPQFQTLSNLLQLNYAYQPWGGRHLPGGAPLNSNPMFDYNVQVKDPIVQQSDDWDFPTGESLSFEWLGRVHRGSPWQTVFLKPSNLTVEQWRTWNNDNIFLTNGNALSIDAAFTHPNNDWRIAGLWAQWLNTNDIFTLLSVNDPDTNAWAARLDGLSALTNAAPGELDPVTISSNSPQAGIIAQAIQTARANSNATNGILFPSHAFQGVGDVLAAPQLSIASPFLNTVGMNHLSANGITDEAMEKIPAQLVPLLRADSFGKIVPANGRLAMSFSGYDGHPYALEVSSNLTDWVIISINLPSDGSFGTTNTATSSQQFYRSILMH
jgi:hypothetical protein